MIYLDHNSTTPTDPLVFEAMQPFLTTFYGNPSSTHRHGRVVKSAIELAREQVARLVNVMPDQVIFTSGGTEANNLAIVSSLASGHGHALLGATEHPSVLEPLKNLATEQHHIEHLKMDKNGLLNVDELHDKANLSTCFVSIMSANNETGVIQKIRDYADFCRSKNIIFHTDAVQSLGKIAVDFLQMEVDLMSLSAHKIYGPKGVGALVYDKKLKINPMLRGGAQENNKRAGTENVAAIIGFGKAAELAFDRQLERANHLLMLRENLEQQLKELPGLSIVAEKVERLPNTVQIVIEGMDGEMMLMLLDQKSIAVSSGSACSSQNKAPSHVLKAMSYSDELALSAIRISLGEQNTLDDIQQFTNVLKDIVYTHRF